jgi:hypothetical protein
LLDELRQAGCTAKELLVWGCSAKDLPAAGYSMKELPPDAGYKLQELWQAGRLLKDLLEGHL